MGILGILLILFIIAFFGLSLSGTSLVIGLKTKSAETVPGIRRVLEIPSPVHEYGAGAGRIYADTDAVCLGCQSDQLAGGGSYWLAVIAIVTVVIMGTALYMFREVVG